jgi:HK97 family phage portal protein
MGLLDRARRFAYRFVNRTRSGWGRVGWRAHRASLEVGDGSSSSIVMAAVGWIMRNFPEAPVRVRRRSGTELEETTDAGALAFRDLLEIPNAWYSGILLWMATVADYWLTGNGYWLKVRNAEDGGRVVALWWIPSWTIEPKGSDEATGDFITHYSYKPTAIDEYEIPPEEVVHFRYGFDPDNVRRGRSPIAAVLGEILTDVEAAAYTQTILRNLGVPGVVISPDEDVEIDDADAIKADFAATFTGEGRGQVMVMSAKTKVDVLTFNPQQMDLRALRRVPEERITGQIGVPAIVAQLGAGLDRSTFANYAEAREAGYEENIIPTQRLFGADLRTQLLVDFVGDIAEWMVDFDVSEVRVLQEDQGKIWERAVKALGAGAITLADFNRMVGLPVDEALHDVYLRDARIVAVRVDSPEATGEEVEEEEPAPPPPGAVPPEDEAPPIPGTAPVEPAVGSRNGNGRPTAPVA